MDSIAEQMLNQQLEDIKNQYVVFLCGPCIKPKDNLSESAKLRQHLWDKLKDDFAVIIPEAKDREQERKSKNLDSQTYEADFIKRTKNSMAIVLIADSVGSHCEFALFSWLFSIYDSKGHDYIDRKKVSFFLIANAKYKDADSYFNEGPVSALRKADGRIEFVDFDKSETFDEIHNTLVEFLRNKKSISNIRHS